MMKFVVLAVCLVAVISAKEVDFLRKRKNHKFSLFSFYLYPGRPVTRQHSKESKSSQVESRDCLNRKRFSRESLAPSKRRTLPVGGMTRNGRKTFTPWPFRLFFFFQPSPYLGFIVVVSIAFPSSVRARARSSALWDCKPTVAYRRRWKSGVPPARFTEAIAWENIAKRESFFSDIHFLFFQFVLLLNGQKVVNCLQFFDWLEKGLGSACNMVRYVPVSNGVRHGSLCY